jgi:hypothetical protein
MPDRATALTAAAGEHYVAYLLSAFGYLAAMTRGGSPTVDLLVGDIKGNAAVSLQVKTSNWARREYKRKPENNHWEWDVGRKALDLKGDLIFYAFVDLKWDPKNPSLPDVFIVPSQVVADQMKPEDTRFMFWLMESEKDQYHRCWDILRKRLG